ncbi:MAG: tetratricopeptide repeat protein, partial [Nitrospinaceae bacterium]
VDQVCDLFPHNWAERALFNEGMMLMVRGHNVTALGVFTRICESDPEAYPAHYFLGYVCGSMGKHKQEIECYRKALRLRPEYPQIHLDTACALRTLGNEGKAYVEMKKAVSLAGDFALLDHWLTFSSDHFGRYQDIYGSEEKVQAEKSRCVAWAYYLLGNAFVEYGLHAAARNAFKNAVRVDPGFARAHYQLGTLHIKKLRNPKRAAKHLEKAENLFLEQGKLYRAGLAHQLLHPQDAPTEPDKAADDWIKEGLRLHQLGRYQAAVGAYKMAIRFRPHFAEAYYDLGIAFGSLEDQGMDTLESAIGALKHAIRLNPDFIHAYTALGAAYLRCGRYPEAVELLEQGALLEPDNPNLFYYLGTAYRMIRDFEQAVKALEQAAAQAPDSVHARFHLGLALLDAERYEEAAAALREALRVKPDLADAHFLLGQLCQERLQDPDAARSHFKKGERLYVKLREFEKAARVRVILESLE